MDPTEYLKQYNNTQRKIVILHNVIDEEHKKIEEIRSSSYFDSKFKSEMVFKSKAYIQKLKDYENEKQKICDEIRLRVMQIPDIKGQILYDRYISNMKWQDIADMEFMSLRNVMRLHKQALKDLQEILDKELTTE